MPSGKQVKAARMLIDWDAQDLADKAGLARETVFKIERGTTNPKPETISKIVQAFSDEGIEFLDNNGVRQIDNTLRVLDSSASYLEVLEDVFMTLHETGGEVLFAFVRNQLSSQEVIESDLRLRRLGISFRSLIEEVDTYCLYPLKEYREVPKQFFQNNVQVIYGDKVASMLNHDKKAFIIHDVGFAETQRKIFNMVWDKYPMPSKTTAEKIYD